MERDSHMGQLNTRQIEQHLRSAVNALTPNVLDRIDLSIPQAEKGADFHSQAAILKLQRRMRQLVAGAAACVCLTVMGGGVFHYHMENRRIESVIGIDVNPSIELSINRKERVLEMRALNEDAEAIIDDMDLVGVDLNVAVNAVVGSMVTHGYLDDLDNAILVTVSNDSVRKARELRSSVVGDIQQTLWENQVEAVVYDQQVIEDEEIQTLARQYGISYGKAYFLKELIDQNPSLSMEDMEELSSMTMEEIARRIGESSYELGELAERGREPETESRTEESTETESTALETFAADSTEETEMPQSSQELPTETAGTTAPPETTQAPKEETADEEVEIDYVDYEDGIVYVHFVDRIKWKNPSVVVRDEQGNSYAAIMDETSRDECSFEVSGLTGGEDYIFVLGGFRLAEDDRSATVKGYFQVPEIAREAVEEDPEEETGESHRETETEPTEAGISQEPAEEGTEPKEETATGPAKEDEETDSPKPADEQQE